MMLGASQDIILQIVAEIDDSVHQIPTTLLCLKEIETCYVRSYAMFRIRFTLLVRDSKNISFLFIENM